VLDRNKDGSLTTDERSQDLRQGGIAPEVALLINPGTDSIPGSGSGGGGGGCQPGVVPCVPCPPGTNCPSPPVCLSGGEAVACPNFNQLNKTYWREGMSN